MNLLEISLCQVSLLIIASILHHAENISKIDSRNLFEINDWSTHKLVFLLHCNISIMPMFKINYISSPPKYSLIRHILLFSYSKNQLFSCSILKIDSTLKYTWLAWHRITDPSHLLFGVCFIILRLKGFFNFLSKIIWQSMLIACVFMHVHSREEKCFTHFFEAFAQFVLLWKDVELITFICLKIENKK